jgi:hypothetical protein
MPLQQSVLLSFSLVFRVFQKKKVSKKMYRSEERLEKSCLFLFLVQWWLFEEASCTYILKGPAFVRPSFRGVLIGEIILGHSYVTLDDFVVVSKSEMFL